MEANCRFQDQMLLRETDSLIQYDSSHSNCYTPEIHQFEKLRYLGTSLYKFKLRFGIHLGLISESICKEEFQDLDLADFGGVAFSVDSVIQHLQGKYQSTECMSVHKAYVRVTF